MTRTNRKAPWAGVLTALLAVVALIAGALVMAAGVQATPAEKIMICHATSAVANPYTTPDVDMSSVDEYNNPDLNGHGDHTGPVFNASMVQGDSWGDIIPPFTYTFTKHDDTITVTFGGLNWSAEGQAIYNNGCELPAPPPPDYYGASTPVCEPVDDAWTPGTLSVPTEYLTEAEAVAALVAKAEADSTGLMIPPFSTYAGSSNYDAAIYNDGTCVRTPPTPPPTPTPPPVETFSAAQPYCALVDAAAGTYTPATLNATGDSQVTADAALKTQATALTAGIVPAFGVGNNAFAGLNWTEDGQAIYNNGCVTPVDTTVEEPATVPPVEAGTVVEQPAKVPLPATIPAGVADEAVVPATIPAGDGSTAPQTPVTLLALLALGAVALTASTAALAVRRI